MKKMVSATWPWSVQVVVQLELWNKHIYLKVLHNSGGDGVFIDRSGREIFELKTALCLLHCLLSRCSAHLGTFVHQGRALGDDTREFGARNELLRLGHFELERLKLVQARRERGCQLALPDQLQDELAHVDAGCREKIYLGVVCKPEDVACTGTRHPMRIVGGRDFSHAL